VLELSFSEILWSRVAGQDHPAIILASCQPAAKVVHPGSFPSSWLIIVLNYNYTSVDPKYIFGT